jgi:glycosyltransferase involved in cell wall biosynthesis/ubiquinone/menaquinone biosynthesis C-methylase UbiE
MLGIGPYLVARARGVPFVLDERDLSLDFAAEMKLLPSPALAIARKVEEWLHRHADLVVAVTPGMETLLKQRGVARLALVPNGFDALSHPNGEGRESIRERLGWANRYVLLYAGGLGRAYDLNTVLDALVNTPVPSTLLAIMGEGEGKEAYRRRADVEHLPVQFLPAVSKRDMLPICAASDVGLLPLRNVGRSSYVLSNKLFDYLGAGTPVIASGLSDSADIIERAGAGVVVPANSPVEMANAITALATQPALRQSMGRAGKAYVQANWARERFVRDFRDLLLKVTGSASQDNYEDQFCRIRAAYRGYDRQPKEQAKRSLENPGVKKMAEGRWAAIASAIEQAHLRHEDRVLDVGCGSGSDLARLAALGHVATESLFGVDLLEDRIANAKRKVPSATLLAASSHDLPFPDDYFSVALASTLFSSVLDDKLARAVASEILRVVRPGGTIICYDVRLPNLTNPNTRAITRRSLRRLFPQATIRAQAHTLLPPLARRLGPFTTALYSTLENIFFLRSHNLAVITVGHKAVDHQG